MSDAKNKRRFVKTMPCDWLEAVWLLLGIGLFAVLVWFWHLIICCLQKYLAA
jgi:hypothetical protein